MKLGKPLPIETTLETAFKELREHAAPVVKPEIPLPLRPFFERQALENLFEINRCTDPNQLIPTLRQQSLPIALSPQEKVRNLNWHGLQDRLSDDCQQPTLAVVWANAAIAETGTVVVRSSDTPSSMIFLAEELVLILEESQIFPDQETLWRQQELGNCRALHLISGPSRTADIEQTLQVGAHGPRRVIIWLVTNDESI